jgi:purine-nucleoside phosphorylase
MVQQLQEAVSYIRSKNIPMPETGIILGTGLSGLVDNVKVHLSIDYAEIPHFATSTVEFHPGRLVFGTMHNREIVLMQGRFHFYEGYSMNQITFPVRVMKLLGIKQLLISNACGAINPAYEAASLMLIDDHINFLPGNPLVGPNSEELGPRFPDMSRPYDPALNKSLKAIAARSNIRLHEGVYAAWMGPNLETRAEYRFLRMAGADVVGMSTVPEVIAANHMKLPVAAISVITDLCDPENLKPINIEEVLAHAANAEKDLGILFSELIKIL